MNYRRETMKMGVPPGNRRVLVSEAYLNGTSQEELVEGTPEDVRKDGYIRGRSR